MTSKQTDNNPTVDISPPFELPEQPPSIPDSLIYKIQGCLPAVRMDLVVEDDMEPGSYSQIMIVRLYGEGHDAAEIAAYLKSRADKFVATHVRHAKFRVLVQRDEGRPTLVRRQVTFAVRSPFHEGDSELAARDHEAERQQVTTDGQRETNESWLAQSTAQRAFTEVALDGMMRANQLLHENCRQTAANRVPIADSFVESERVYRAGLRARAEAVDTIAQLQLEVARLSGTTAPESSPLDKILALIGPVIGPAAQAFFAALMPKNEPDTTTRQLPSRTHQQPPPVSAPPPKAQIVTIAEPTPAPPPKSTPVDSVAVERRVPAEGTGTPPSLLDVISGLLASIETPALLQLLKALDDRQREALYALGDCCDDDEAARGIVTLVDALAANPAALLALRDVLSPEQLSAFEKLVNVCKARCAEIDEHDNGGDEDRASEEGDDDEPSVV